MSLTAFLSTLAVVPEVGPEVSLYDEDEKNFQREILIATIAC